MSAERVALGSSDHTRSKWWPWVCQIASGDVVIFGPERMFEPFISHSASAPLSCARECRRLPPPL
jgi:hypothetical protein